MNEKKYTVFISSTLEDLRECRDSVLHGILRHGHFPLGMEFWGAANDQQWQIICRQIDISDYYIVIVAHRYGSVQDGISWTEREYDYAVSKGVPVLGFVVADDASWLPEHIDKGAAATKLKNFRKKVLSRPVSFWRDAADLKMQVILALSQEIQATPRIGWIRGDEAFLPATANEMARLSEENAKLRAHLAELSAAELPDVVFEVARAELYSDYDDTTGKECRRFTAQIWIRSTLRKGVPVGISPTTSTAAVAGANDNDWSAENGWPLAIEFATEKGASLGDLVITGPTNFRMIATSNFDPWQTRKPNFDIQLGFTLRPTGYERGYDLNIHFVVAAENSQGRITWKEKPMLKDFRSALINHASQ